jgi:hypothetical protein
MRKTRCWIAAAAVLAALAASPVWAQNETFANNRSWSFGGIEPLSDAVRDLVNRDRNQVKLNGSAQWVTDRLGENMTGRLRLTGGGGQASSAFIKTPFTISDYEVDFTFEVRRLGPGETPGDGFTFVAQAGDDNEIGAGGGALGYARSDFFILPSGARGDGIPGYSYAVEFNSYPPQGLSGAPETIALDILGLRTRFNQTPFRFVDQSSIRTKVRVRPQGLTVSVMTGFNVFTPIYQSPSWMNGFFNPPRRLFLGFTAGTGGARQIVDIFGLGLGSNQRL